MSDFEKALKFVLEHECVFAKHHYGDYAFVVSEDVPNDTGSLTKFGIDRKSHPGVNIEGLTLEQATEIYRHEYWDKYHCADLPWPLSLVHFDGCVNMGAHQQVKNLQRVVGAEPDGAWGPKTKEAALTACSQRAPEVVALQVCEQKRQFYVALVKEKPEKGEFLDGWINRTNDLCSAVSV
jgi:lysozyme family protein